MNCDTVPAKCEGFLFIGLFKNAYRFIFIEFPAKHLYIFVTRTVQLSEFVF